MKSNRNAKKQLHTADSRQVLMRKTKSGKPWVALTFFVSNFAIWMVGFWFRHVLSQNRYHSMIRTGIRRRNPFDSLFFWCCQDELESRRGEISRSNVKWNFIGKSGENSFGMRVCGALAKKSNQMFWQRVWNGKRLAFEFIDLCAFNIPWAEPEMASLDRGDIRDAIANERRESAVGSSVIRHTCVCFSSAQLIFYSFRFGVTESRSIARRGKLNRWQGTSAAWEREKMTKRSGRIV